MLTLLSPWQVIALLAFTLCSCTKACGATNNTSATPIKASQKEAVGEKETGTTTPPLPDLPKALLLTYAQFAATQDGKTGTKPGAARLEILSRKEGRWSTESLEDPESNVFHKAFPFRFEDKNYLVTLGGSKAAVKFWQRDGSAWKGESVWSEDFGGRFSRMRDAEVGTFASVESIVVGTHDQGVVAILSPKARRAPKAKGEQEEQVARKSDGNKRELAERFKIKRLDRKPNTFIHEIELGDLDGDGELEIYATPSEPNKIKGGPQRGSVLRYTPKNGAKRTVANLGKRHAKEILVEDVDADGRDELYVVVEALTKQSESGSEIVEPVQILRFDEKTSPTKGQIIASIDDRQCRFLTVGDFDGDGKKEMVAAAYKSGLWLLRPGATGDQPWKMQSIDKNSSGFEHAALAADLDEDKRDELYVAADDEGELRRYTWQTGKPHREVIVRRHIPKSRLTWNITTIDRDQLPSTGTSAK